MSRGGRPKTSRRDYNIDGEERSMENFLTWAQIALDAAIIALGAYGIHLLRRRRK